ncbi:hypothetical protein, partial [Treponema pedis]
LIQHNTYLCLHTVYHKLLIFSATASVKTALKLWYRFSTACTINAIPAIFKPKIHSRTSAKQTSLTD